MKRAFPAAVAAILATALPLIAQDRFSLSGDRVAIYNLAGELRVEAGSGSDVVVELTRGGRDADRLKVDRHSSAGWQQLVIRYPDDRIVYRQGGWKRFSRTEFNLRDDGTFGIANLDPALGAERIKKGHSSTRGGDRVRVSGSGSGLEAHADLVIAVPAGKAVAIHLGVGKVVASNINGDLQIDARSASIEATGITGFGRFDTGSGSVTLRNGEGDFGAHTGSGGIHVENVSRGALVAATGSGGVEVHDVDVSELEIRTGSGSVTVASVNAPAARVTTGSGGIRAQQLGARNFDLNTGSGSVRVELTQDVNVGRIDTGSGGVTVAISHDAGAEVTIDTGSGGIDVDAPGFVVNETRRSFMRGRIGDGNGTLHVSTGSGGVNFRSM